MYEDYSLGENL